MKNEKFLQKVANELLNTYKDTLSSSIILVPNKRTRSFLFEYLREKITIPIFSPLCLSSEEYAIDLSGLQKAERLPLLFQLYQSYKTIYQKKGKNFVSFEDFYFLGTTLLADFDEIDRHLVDVSKLCEGLKKLQNYEKGAPTIAEAFSNLWDCLGDIYTDFTNECLKNKKAYSGLIYRKAQETVSSQTHPLHENATHIFWIGFHVLSPAEKNIFSSTKEKNIVFLDMDTYFTEDIKQEAGFFYRNFWEKTLPPEEISWNENLLSQKDQRNFHIFATTNETTMVKLLGEQLHNKLQQENNTAQKRPDKVAIILPKEELLFAVLNSLPPTLSSVNVTMGFPLRATQIASWIEVLLSLRESLPVREGLPVPSNQEETSLSGALLIELLDHQYTRLLAENETLNAMIATIRDKNMSRVSQKAFDQLLSKKESFQTSLYEWFWNPQLSGTQILEILFGLVKELLGTHRKRELSFDCEFIYVALQHLGEIQNLVKEKNLNISFEAVAKILRDVFGQTTIAFSGEPLEGWQIMGVLETQALDFDSLYILSMNEGVFPAASSRQSFIPQDIRKALDLPQPFETEAMYAYHFYRLLKRAKEISLFYTKETKDTGLQEKSRYIEQILFEYLPHHSTIGEKTYTYPFASLSRKEISYPKTEAIRQKLLSFTYSATSIKTYFTCSLRFYYQYILGVGETKTLEEAPDAAIKGTIIHSVMEELFKPETSFENKNDIESLKHYLPDLIEKAIREEFSDQPVKGRLALLKTFVNKQLTKVIETHKSLVPFTILECETEFFGSLTIGDKTLQLTSRIDRIDKQNGSFVIIDYKTGKKESLSIPLKSTEKQEKTLDENFIITLHQNKNRTHLFQLLLYAWLVKNGENIKRKNQSQKNPYKNSLSSLQICYIKEGTFSSVERKDTPFVFDNEIESVFVKGITNALSLILSEEPFVQTKDTTACLFCPFQQLCGPLTQENS
ncbi:MAG: PD-(D/E)XK nuclease family protein [Brevinematales bacterium]|nr:PD-(D/E)XK nuclease family protein [Brevinematales bacterium]